MHTTRREDARYSQAKKDYRVKSDNDTANAGGAGRNGADTSALEREIDAAVYYLYGLTFDEAKIIDGTLTEEEFRVDGER